MPQYANEFLEELRSRVPIEQLVAEYVPLKQKGRRFWGCCPFHNEKTPSFSVDTETQFYYCFGCHKGGTVFQFMMDMEHMEFGEVVKELAERVHMPIPNQKIPTREQDQIREERERIYEANIAAARFFHALLWSADGTQALNYLYRRGLTDKDIKHFGLGVSPHSWDGLYKELISQGFSEETLIQADLVKKRENRIHDTFHDRVIFPIINAQGRVLGFGGRVMGDGQPKYLNTSDTPVFNKRQGLYAMNFAKKERNVGHMILVEGYMDTVSLRRVGIQGVVATLGTALTEEQARLIKRYVPEVWISYDGDKAGQKAALRAIGIFEAEGVPAKVLDYPSGMDPDDFIKANGVEGFQRLRKLSSVEYRLIRAKDDLDLSIQDGKTQYALRACEILRNMKNPVEMENFIKQLVNETGFDREVILRQIGASPLSELPEAARVNQRKRTFRKQIAEEDYILAERQLLSMLARDLIPISTIQDSDFDHPVHQGLYQVISGKGPMNQYIESLPEDERNIAMTALNYSPLAETREAALYDAESCLACIHKHIAEGELARLSEESKTADPERKREIGIRIQRLLEQL